MNVWRSLLCVLLDIRCGFAAPTCKKWPEIELKTAREVRMIGNRFRGVFVNIKTICKMRDPGNEVDCKL